MKAVGVLVRLRTPKAAQVVQVQLTGTASAVAAVARALASVTVVSSMSHHVNDRDGEDGTVRVDVTCHPVGVRGGGR
jgi:hypothetical protein